ncbi:uncharacterized protein CTRU02_212049 [Colletotrichum truncatum]|uniref:Uncharacterized protein n=1 Tax=Colletotrichum truncatum TaxID=5467 RepID=A0ACC3YMH7_COLTU|nr:uncharacterized protein CTRU02_06881 [Colletotrichum truncatum]KAF6792264.1 hypothetical protein CTRU02_06881 [Colletotrichum truncatum]
MGPDLSKYHVPIFPPSLVDGRCKRRYGDSTSTCSCRLSYKTLF